MKVIEIFDSIDGEGIFTGCLATFIRLSGCNMRCRYCDTEYSFTGGEEMSVDDILKAVKDIGNKHITITGGEPLIHKDIAELINVLCDAGYIVNIETNGSVDVKQFQNDNTVITMDYKTISSGENSKMQNERINSLRECDVLKIVCRESDFSDMYYMLSTVKTKAHIFVSPIFCEIEPQKLVDFVKTVRDHKICDNDDICVQVQLHKIIWQPDARGV